jgi:hypothetical protein
LKENILFYYILIFAVAAAETLLGVATDRERGVRAGGSYELDAARSNQNRFLFLILDLSGGFSWKV